MYQAQHAKLIALLALQPTFHLFLKANAFQRLEENL